MNQTIHKLAWLRHLLTALTLATALASTSAASAQLDSDANRVQSASAISGVVNLNTATEEELVRLPGIGPAKAQAILRMREQRGTFKKVEDLMNVRGIGRKTFRKLQPMLTLQGPTTLQ